MRPGRKKLCSMYNIDNSTHAQPGWLNRNGGCERQQGDNNSDDAGVI